MITIERIIGIVVDFSGLSREVVLSRSRKKEIVIWRHLIAYSCKSWGYTLKAIGTALDNRDHITIRNSVKRIEDLLFTKDKYVTDTYEVLNKQISKQYEEYKNAQNRIATPKRKRGRKTRRRQLSKRLGRRRKTV